MEIIEEEKEEGANINPLFHGQATMLPKGMQPREIKKRKSKDSKSTKEASTS